MNIIGDIIKPNFSEKWKVLMSFALILLGRNNCPKNGNKTFN